MEDLWVQLYDREGPLGHKRPACMLLFAFLRGGFSIHCHSADEELDLIQTQMTQKPMLRAEVHARALRASQNRKEGSL